MARATWEATTNSLFVPIPADAGQGAQRTAAPELVVGAVRTWTIEETLGAGGKIIQTATVAARRLLPGGGSEAAPTGFAAVSTPSGADDRVNLTIDTRVVGVERDATYKVELFLVASDGVRWEPTIIIETEP